MSWDIFIMDYPREIETANDIPDDFDPPFIGHRTDLMAKISEALPDADFTNPEWGLLERPGWSIEFYMGDEEKLKSIVLHVRGGGGAVEVIAQILDLCKPPVKCIWTWGCVFWHDVFFGESSCQTVASTGDVRFRPWSRVV